MKYVVEMGSGGMIYIPGLMKFGTGLQALLRLGLSNLRGCNVGIIGWRVYEVGVACHILYAVL
jgi:hypothetical protein